jgi:antitoxin component YwqK of YwqJK toxin-antitoxin module
VQIPGNPIFKQQVFISVSFPCDALLAGTFSGTSVIFGAITGKHHPINHMKKHLLNKKHLLLLFLLIPFSLSAQQRDTIYLDEEHCMSSRDNAYLYLSLRDIKERGSNVTWTQDAYLMNTGELIASTPVKYYKNHTETQNPPHISYYFIHAKEHGQCKLFYKNGRLKQSNMYTNGYPDGGYETYHPNGRPEIQGSIKYREWIINNYFDSTGTDQLHDGNALISAYDEEFDRLVYREISGFVLKSSFYIDPDNGDSVYTYVHTSTKPGKTWNSFYRKLGRIQIPISEKRRHMGHTLKVAFVLLEDGTIDRVRALNTISPVVDQAVLTTIKNIEILKSPVVYNGKKVKAIYHIPFTIQWDGSIWL